MALKAEVLLAIQLITRHRAPRLVLLLVASLVFVFLSGGPEAADVAGRQRSLLLISGSLGAVAGSRLLARGGPLGSARFVATSSIVPALGRLAGSLLLTGPVLFAVSLTLLPGGALLAQTMTAALLLGAVSSAVTMALAPAVGASSAATLGFVAALFGSTPPSAVAVLLESLPPARTLAVILWNTLPLSWRPARWLAGGPALDPWFLAAWLLAAVWLAALAIERFPERDARGEDP